CQTLRRVSEADGLESGAKPPVGKLLEVSELAKRLAEPVTGGAIEPGQVRHFTDAERWAFVAEQLEDRHRAGDRLDSLKPVPTWHRGHSYARGGLSVRYLECS